MDNNNKVLIFHSLETQLNQRLEKLWRVFSWCSDILVSITGGLIALKKIKELTIGFQDSLLIWSVIIVLSVYAYLMIGENLIFEKKIRDQIDAIFDRDLNYPQYKELRPDKARFGYKIVVLLLGATALLATWTDGFFSC